MEFFVDIVSESEALRRCNLPATPRWRKFLRGELAHQDAGVGKVYEQETVDALARKVRDFAGTVIPIEEYPAPTLRELEAMDKLSDRRGPSV